VSRLIADFGCNSFSVAAGYNFRRLIRWLRLLLYQILTALFPGLLINPA
jgi:IS5 family transposase